MLLVSDAADGVSGKGSYNQINAATTVIANALASAFIVFLIRSYTLLIICLHNTEWATLMV